ncbi:MAG TPA: LON peptidase substrate-binding domain-containing protein [Flavipsychrobacter sp.]|nr:LON peptidase substrate-binding domain-containing protein [Flavipsychrobacter sp.]
MINFIPIFPLNIVVFPGEPLNLHVFEPRYKQLARECLRENKTFGIPCVLDSGIEEYGTLMEITEMVQEYDNGELDIRTKGLAVFRVLELVKTIPDKLYSGAIVDYPTNIVEHGDTNIAKIILDEVKRLYTLLNVEEKFPAHKASMISYDVAHYIGLSQQEEYELLCLLSEVQRLEYIRRHLNNMLPTIKELEEMKIRIKRNGHFRDLSLDDLNL